MPKPMFALGIDPGKTGAIAVFKKEQGSFILKTVLDFSLDKTIIIFLKELVEKGTIACAYMELVHAAPGQGVVSMFSFGENFGWWKGVLETLNIEYQLVTPQTWQGSLFRIYKNKSIAFTTKEKSLSLANNLFDTDFFKRKKDHGRSDAALIGWYGIMNMNRDKI